MFGVRDLCDGLDRPDGPIPKKQKAEEPSAGQMWNERELARQRQVEEDRKRYEAEVDEPTRKRREARWVRHMKKEEEARKKRQAEQEEARREREANTPPDGLLDYIEWDRQRKETAAFELELFGDSSNKDGTPDGKTEQDEEKDKGQGSQGAA